MIYAYVRVSTEQQSSSSQKFEIEHWASKNNIKIDRWISESVSGTVAPSKRRLGECLSIMKKDDLLVCTEISRLGRNMLMIMSILNDCASKELRIHTIKDNFDLSNNINSKIIAFAFALAAEIERNLISQRTKEALADRKASGVTLGRPKGSSRKRDSFMLCQSAILSELSSGVNKSEIARRQGISRSTLSRYLTGH